MKGKLVTSLAVAAAVLGLTGSAAAQAKSSRPSVAVMDFDFGTVLAEQDFARSDRADPSAAKLAKVGKVLGVKYIIAGSITKFGGEEKNYGGGGLVKGKLGGLGLKKAKTEVSITVRMIDATTGEILMSTKGEGLSKKGGGLKVGALGGGGGAGFSMS